MLQILSNLRMPRGRRGLVGAAAAAAMTMGISGPVTAQTAGQSVAQLVAAGYQVLAFVPSQMGQGYATLLVNYRDGTPSLLLCNINLNATTRQMVTSGCFEVL